MASPDGRLAAELQRRIVSASAKRRTRRAAPRARPPKAAEQAYTSALERLLEPLLERALAKLDKLAPEIIEAAPLPRSDARQDADPSQMIARVMSELRVEYAERVNARTIAPAAAEAGQETSQHTRREVARQVRSVFGIEMPMSDPNLAAQLALFRDQNVALVTNMASEELSKLELMLQDAARSGTRVETLRERIQQRLGVTRSRAQLIARDQVLKLNGEITQLRQREVGVEEYEWVTSAHGEPIAAQEAEQVRHRHAELDGSIQRWDKPPIVDTKTGRRAHPGGDYQCRCIANPVFRFNR